ncbi:hypothetical protein EV715DRAFT_268623, partial [Schizophyllum commune]
MDISFYLTLVLRLFLLRQRLAHPEHPIIKLFKLPLIVLSAKLTISDETHRRCTVKPMLFPPTGQIKAHQSYASREAQMAQQAYATSQKVMQFKYWVVRLVTAAAPTSQKVDKNVVVPVQGLMLALTCARSLNTLCRSLGPSSRGAQPLRTCFRPYDGGDAHLLSAAIKRRHCALLARPPFLREELGNADNEREILDFPAPRNATLEK